MFLPTELVQGGVMHPMFVPFPVPQAWCEWAKKVMHTRIMYILGWKLFAGTFFCSFNLKHILRAQNFSDLYAGMVQGQHILMLYSA